MKVTEFPWTVDRVVLLSPALSFERSGSRGAERTAARENSDRSGRGQSRHRLDGWTLLVYFLCCSSAILLRVWIQGEPLTLMAPSNSCFVKRKEKKNTDVGEKNPIEGLKADAA